MKTTLTKRGQTVVPAEIRRNYRMGQGTVLQWIDTGEGIRVIPLPEDVIEALHGSTKGKTSVDKLLKSRREDRLREKRK